MWACPGVLGPLLGGVNTLGPMTDDYSTVPAWLSRDKTLVLSCLHLGKPTFERSSVGGVPGPLHKVRI